MGLDEVLPELRRPFTVEAVKAKIQTAREKNSLLVFYIDARLAADRLNHVCPGEWTDEYVPTPWGQGLECRLTVAGVERRDVGFATGRKDGRELTFAEVVQTDMGLKAVYSDAFKRAAVKFGIGASLYALPKLVVQNNLLSMWKNKPHLFDDSPAWTVIRKHYADWLDGGGAKYFGEPLGHGDTEGAQGDVETQEAPQVVADADPKVPVRYVDWLRLAIRQHSKDELADEEEWERLIASATSTPEKQKIVDSLEAALVEHGGDPDQVKARWSAQTAVAS